MAMLNTKSTASSPNLFNSLFSIYEAGVAAKEAPATTASKVLTVGQALGLSRPALEQIIVAGMMSKDAKLQEKDAFAAVKGFLDQGKATLESDFSSLVGALNPPGASFTGEYGGALKGETGLRAGYAPYVENVLGRMQGLLSLRDVKEGKAPPETGFGISYGMNTARQLSDIQRALQRQAGIAPRDEDITGCVS